MAKSKRSAENEAFWRWIMEEQQRSGLTVRAFCQREGIAEPSFYGWRREIKRRDASNGLGRPIAVDVSAQDGADEKRSHPSAPAGERQHPQQLIPVDVVDLVSNGGSPPPIEVLTPSGFTLRVPQDIQPQRLDGLLKVVASCQAAEVRRKGATAC